MKYRSKPVEIEAMQWDGTIEGYEKIFEWSGKEDEYLFGFLSGYEIQYNRIEIDTLEGRHFAIPSDWIIKGLIGEFYPCKDEVFKMKYEKVED